MKLKFILLIALMLMLTLDCERQTNGRRKIKLVIDQANNISQSNFNQSTILKLKAEEQRSIAILIFENQTEDQNLAWLSQGITDMLIRDLSQSRYLKVVTMQRIFDILKDLKINSPNTVDYKMIYKIGERSQAEALIKGSFKNKNDSLMIDVELFDINSRKLVQQEMVNGQGLEQIFTMVDELSDRIKSDLRLSFKGEDEHDLKIADISTKSVEAYKNYTEGVDLVYKAYFGDAIKKFEQAIKNDSTFAMTYFWAAITYSMLNKMNKARQSIDRAVKYSENATLKEKMKIQWVHATYNEEHEKSFNLLKELVKAYPDDKEIRYQLAGNYYYRKEIDKAEKQLQQALQLDPNYVQVYSLYSVLYREKGEYENAIKCLEKCIQVKPEDAAPYHNLGDMYEIRGDHNKAIKYFEKAIAIKPDFYFSAMDLAHIHSTLGEYEKAREEYLSVLDILPSEELKARVYVGLAQIDLSLGKYNHAIDQLTQALQYSSSENSKSDYFTMLAGIYLRKGMCDSTFAITSKVLEYNRSNLSVYSVISEAFLKKGEIDSAKKIAQKIDYDIKKSKFEIFRNIHLRLLGKIAAAEERYYDAINYYQKILADNPEATTIYQELGLVYMDKKEPANAIESYLKYIEKKPNDALIHYQLALAYDAFGDKKKATKLIQKFLDMWQEADPDIPELVKAKQLLGMG